LSLKSSKEREKKLPSDPKSGKRKTKGKRSRAKLLLENKCREEGRKQRRVVEEEESCGIYRPDRSNNSTRKSR
jgi:hypothetical protein